jgi:ATP-dependent Clp protease protease subunit
MTFKYVQNLESDEPVMLINKHIGFDEEDGQGIDGSLFQQELLALDQMGKKRIQIWINSVGGLVMDGYNICNAILKSSTRVDTYCLGMAASIAGVIFQTGRKRYMADYGILMYHNPYTSSTQSSPLLDSMKESLNTIIAQKSGMATDAVHRMMDRTSFIGAAEAKDMGLCDEVEATVKLNTKNYPRSLADDSTTYRIAANKILNKLINANKMIKVTNKLGLNDDANEASILDAIATIENKLTASEVLNKKTQCEMDKMKNDMDESENKFKELKDKYDEACNELEVANKAKEVVELAIKTDKATNMVNSYVQAGAIKNEAAVIADWVSDAVIDFAKVENRLKAIPVNKTAAKFVINTAVKEAVKYQSVAADMVKISNRIDTKK